VKIVVLYLLLVNIIAFLMMGADKLNAQAGEWRIPEKSLFLAVLLGGGIGGCLGMRKFHHKTRKLMFRIGFPAITAIEFLLLLTMLN